MVTRWRDAVLGFVLAGLLPALAMALPPPNDDCAAATVVSGLEFGEYVDTTDATTEASDPLLACTSGGASQNGHSIWYAFTPTTPGVLFYGSLGSDYDTVVAIHTGTCGALTTVRCNDNFFPDGTSSTAVEVQAGTTYLLEHTAHASAAGGTANVYMWLEPDSPACPSLGDTITGFQLRLTKLGAPLWDERLSVKGEFFNFTAPTPDLSTVGLQLRIEDAEAGYQPLYDLSSAAIPVPPGLVGTGCDPRDGWKVRGRRYTYTNRSNAFPPCAPGSAQGLRRASVVVDEVGFVKFKASAKVTTIPDASGDYPQLRFSLALGADASAPSTYGCGITFSSGCTRSGSRVTCRQ